MTTALAIVGFGSLGRAIAHGALSAKLLLPAEITVIAEPGPAGEESRAHAREHGMQLANHDALRDTKVILLSVKPQSFREVAAAIGRVEQDGALVISIMAGINSAQIRDALGGSARVCRLMPNMAASVGHAITAIASDAQITAEDFARVEKLCTSIGRSVRVPESLFDAVTATSGSGPAFLYRFLESWEQAAENLGLPKDIAQTLARETLFGAAELLRVSGASPRTLRAKVTSKGGTTAAGMTHLDAGLDAMVEQTLRSARDRGAELANSA
ncbi:MAG: pyrroline-5-carboxylate reductase [Phycisphaerales bacterium]|nr:pyrroline-5-carboxylate reductase [Phycisphaerales bacterium]